jgi:enoyl-CoA hydratase/carnithine racemase
MNGSSSLLLIDHPAAGVTRVQLNRPEARNALSTALRQALAQAFTALDEDGKTRCILLTGGDRFFAAGADLKEFATLDPVGVHRLQAPRYWKAIADCSKPIVAAVAGVALGGGCELALHADVIIAGRGASFGLPEVGVGIMPGGGATQRLVRAIGHYRAMKLLLMGKPVSAEEAWRLGMVTEVVDDEQLADQALVMATAIASRPPLAHQFIKQSVLLGADAPLGAGLALERRNFELLFGTQDQKEGMRAFMERRAPVFTGD